MLIEKTEISVLLANTGTFHPLTISEKLSLVSLTLILISFSVYPEKFFESEKLVPTKLRLKLLL